MLCLKTWMRVRKVVGELERTSPDQPFEDPVVLENPVELVSATSCSVELEGTSENQPGEDPVVLENPVELTLF